MNTWQDKALLDKSGYTKFCTTLTAESMVLNERNLGDKDIPQ